MEVDPVIYTLRCARLAKGLSQREVARRMGTTQSAISELESGVTSPILATVRRYAEVVEVTISAGY